MKKIWKFLSSMKFAVALLVLLAIACALSSLVEQGLTREAYTARYGETAASVILALQADHAYHSVWFIALSGFLCLNLILCNIIRFPAYLRRYRQSRKIGVWGAWVCHIGVLLLIAGFALGQITLQETVIWGMPGDTRTMQETGLEITIDDFRTETREDASVSQYVTEITVRDPSTGKTEQASVSVNHPAQVGGFHLYQNNTGTAASAVVTRDGREIQRKTLLPAQSMAESVMGLADQPEYAFYFAGVRTMQADEQAGKTLHFYDLYRSGELQQSYYFFDEGKVEVGGDEVTFTPGTFTLLVARRDQFAPMALAGGLITLAGLFMAFYLKPKAPEYTAEKREEKKDAEC